VETPLHFKPDKKQLKGSIFLLNNPTGAIFADPGRGKTALTLHYLKMLKLIAPPNKRLCALIVAPKAVIRNTWIEEMKKWNEFNSFSYSILSSGKKSLKLAELNFVSTDSVRWLFSNFSKFSESREKSPFGVLVVDESTKFKNVRSKRFKSIKQFAPRFNRRVILTGTPIPNSLQDIFPQIYLLDLGEALGKYVTHFRERYFIKTGYMGYTLEAKPNAQKNVEEKISHLVYRIENKRLIEPKINNIYIDLPPKVRKIYNEVEKNLFAIIGDEDYLLPSASSAYNACRQIASGGLYEAIDIEAENINRKTFSLHCKKAEMLEHMIGELQGSPLLIGYHYKFIVDQIKKHLKKRVPAINGETNAKSIAKTIRDWNHGKIQVLLGQPQSMGHGLNLQHGPCKNICWYNLTDNFENYDQFNRRIIGRKGSKTKVVIHHILARDTLDEVIIGRFEEKNSNQKSFLNSLRLYGEKQNLL
jgi:SNF2 family DNA or RNA helicase